MDASTVLRQSPLFEDLGDEEVGALARSARLLEIASGSQLYARGTACDSIYIVASGQLRAIYDAGRIVASITRLEPTGEISAVMNEPHSADVYAVRDSVVVQLPVAELLATLRHFPDAMLRLMRMITRRLRQNAHTQSRTTVRRRNSFAVIYGTPGAAAQQVAQRLNAELHNVSASLLVDAASVDAVLGAGASAADSNGGNHRLVEYLNTLEAEHPHLVLLSNPQADAWARRCMAQADRILVVIDPQSQPDSAMVEMLRGSGAQAPVEVVMLRPDGAGVGELLRWMDKLDAAGHFFVRPQLESDWKSLSRQLSGRGIGVVFGGGGARGFAHLGLLRAMQELDLPVDLVGGTSMGAFFAALTACGYDHEEQRRIARETFVNRNFLNDYLLPTISLIRGRKFTQRLHDIFGERSIESLRKPFFCVTTNLTRGRASVHRSGPLYLWTATSMSVPGVAPPLVCEGELHADGAVINSLPTDVMQGMERGAIIASDVSTEGGIAAPGIKGPDPEGLFRYKDAEAPRLFSILFRTATLTSESGVAQRAARADCYLRMPVSRIGMFDWKRMDEIIDRGYQHAMAQLSPLRDALLPG
ncbi:NTE family protein [Solimonas aquatica]|uniref:NTE family protein n=1 Tax=Solimonas aquatica TaxID=489703 RepID=A0A1H9MER9_9GAMM|nr:patatin-like phospholipase family protein [Solimonas aquatica]SER22178.1 NTE family protein [Solimonas aquatica]